MFLYGLLINHLCVYLGCDSHTSFKVKRSKVRVTRPINADTHRAPYLPNDKVYEFQTWYTTTCISHRRRDFQDQRSRSQGHVISLSRVGRMAHKSKTNSRSITKIGRRVHVLHCAPVSRSKGQRSRSQAD